MTTKKRILNFVIFYFHLPRWLKLFTLVSYDIALISTLISVIYVDYLEKEFFHSVIIIAILVSLISGYVFGVYSNVTRYITKEILIRLFGVSLSLIFSVVLMSAFLSLTIYISELILLLLLHFNFTSAFRFGIRQVLRIWLQNERENILIYGDGEEAVELLNSLYTNPDFRAVGFLSVNPKNHNLYLGGIRVYTLDQLESISNKFDVQYIFFADRNVERKVYNEIVKLCAGKGLKFKRIPNIAQVISGKLSSRQLQDVEPQDLLGRDSRTLMNELFQMDADRNSVLVTGGGGSIGSELCRQLQDISVKRIIILEHSEFALYQIAKELSEFNPQNVDIIPVLGSILDRDLLKQILHEYAVSSVFHAAAYKHVPIVEQNIFSAIRNNVFGTYRLIEAIQNSRVKSFTLVSTDKAVRPTNVMGATKRIAELICQAFASHHGNGKVIYSTVRFGNVLGSSGSVIPLFKKQIERGGPITLTHKNITRFFMTISEAAQLVIQSASLARGGDTFLLDMGKPVKMLELAKTMIRLSGKNPVVMTTHADIGENDMGIEIIGLRKGEKLYEELLIDTEAQNTIHPDIFRANETFLDMEIVLDFLAQLEVAMVNRNEKLILEILKNMPIGYNQDTSTVSNTL